MVLVQRRGSYVIAAVTYVSWQWWFRVMTAFDAVGLVLAAFLAFLLVLHVTVFVGVLTFHHTREGLRQWRNRHMYGPAGLEPQARQDP